MEAIFSSETLDLSDLQDVATQRKVLFIVTAVRT
jgi:hypothetical protein